MPLVRARLAQLLLSSPDEDASGMSGEGMQSQRQPSGVLAVGTVRDPWRSVGLEMAEVGR